MQDRDTLILNIRPELPMTLQEKAVSASEQFQNRTLRPILKYQNDLLLSVFKQYLIKRKGTYFKLTAAKKLDYIEHAIKKDLNFKNRLLGIILGLLTTEEWSAFIENEGELSRRCTEMIIQRLQSQVIELG